jgi:transcriptional regulator of NAD metabolism
MWTLIFVAVYGADTTALQHSKHEDVFKCMAEFERVYSEELPRNKEGLMLVCVKGDRNEVSSDY